MVNFREVTVNESAHPALSTFNHDLARTFILGLSTVSEPQCVLSQKQIMRKKRRVRNSVILYSKK